MRAAITINALGLESWGRSYFMGLSKYALFCIETGRPELVYEEIRKHDSKKKFQASWRYAHPSKPKENPTNDRRAYYRGEYLKSHHWKQLRRQKLAISPNCEKCGTIRRLDVHHLNYRNLYDVLLSDLMTLCRRCHSAEHKCKQRVRAGE